MRVLLFGMMKHMVNQQIQTYIRLAASRGRDTEKVGPFLATFSRHTELIFLNYAVPDDNAEPSTDDVAALIAAYERRNRKPRLEYLPSLAPSVEPALVEAGFAIEGLLPLMIYAPNSQGNTLTPEGIEIVTASSDADFLATLIVQFEAYGETSAPSPEDIARLRSSVAAGGIAVFARDSESGEPAGAGVCAPPFVGVTELAAIGVRHAFRRRGIAGAVTTHLACEASAAGITTIFLTPAHDEGERIYNRVGFQSVSKMLHISKQ